MRASRKAAPLALAFAIVIATSLTTDAGASTVKFVVDSPKSGGTVVNQLLIQARLETRQSASIKVARFYADGKLVATDRRAPFTTSPASRLDTNTLPTATNRIELSVTYTTRAGQTRTLNRSVRVERFRPPTAALPLPTNRWRETFSDDFNNAAYSRARWETQRDDWIKGPIPYSNLEGAGYRPDNVRVHGGVLNLSTSSSNASGFRQSTGSVNTHGAFSFRYGYIEARILVPRCDGCWPSFWMLPRADHWPPEIDIIEYFDTAKQVIPYSAVHWPANNRQRERYFSQRLMISDQDNYIGTWHTYAALWTKDTVQFYIDGVAGPQFMRPSRIPHKAMYPIIQLAVGRGYRPKAGSTMQVDYVRVWQRR